MNFAEQVRELVAEQAQASERYKYNSAGYILLGLAIEAIIGQTYFDYVRQNVFTRAKMAQADFIPLDAVTSNLAEGYILEEDDEAAICGSMVLAMNLCCVRPESSSAGDTRARRMA